MANDDPLIGAGFMERMRLAEAAWEEYWKVATLCPGQMPAFFHAGFLLGMKAERDRSNS